MVSALHYAMGTVVSVHLRTLYLGFPFNKFQYLFFSSGVLNLSLFKLTTELDFYLFNGGPIRNILRGLWASECPNCPVGNQCLFVGALLYIPRRDNLWSTWQFVCLRHIWNCRHQWVRRCFWHKLNIALVSIDAQLRLDQHRWKLLLVQIIKEARLLWLLFWKLFLLRRRAHIQLVERPLLNLLRWRVIDRKLLLVSIQRVYFRGDMSMCLSSWLALVIHAYSLAICDHLLNLLAYPQGIFNSQVGALSIFFIRDTSISSWVSLISKRWGHETISTAHYTFDIFRQELISTQSYLIFVALRFN